MFTLRDSIVIQVPVERCLLLSTSIEVVAKTLGMRPVEGKLGRMIEAGTDCVRGWKFELPQMHETLVTAFDKPVSFQDTMGRGRFAKFQHDHTFMRWSRAYCWRTNCGSRCRAVGRWAER